MHIRRINRMRSDASRQPALNVPDRETSMSFAGIGLRGRNSRVRVEVLTNREKLVFQALRDGLTALETAKALAVSINTIKFHRKNRYSKLGVGSRLDAVRRFDAGEEAYSSWHA